MDTKSNKYYLTTAIPYVNAPPHIGHALEFVQADTIAKYHALKGQEVFLTTGVDENSIKCVQAAAKQNITTKALCDANSNSFREFVKSIGMHYDAFVRSSQDEAHWNGVEKLWNMCMDSDDIYKKTYSGLYCTGCEAFYTQKDLVNGLCPEHLTKPDVVKEENYFFRLSKYSGRIREMIDSGSLVILPKERKNEIIGQIDEGLEDFSISRSNERAKGWGIAVPKDESQKIYVWFDALSIYLTSIGFGSNEQKFKSLWPADMHIIGKGIIRFHAIYWPAMLMSAGLEMPKHIIVHGYVTSKGQKISKSLGNVVDPMAMIDKYEVNAVRYYLLRGIPTFEDGDFSENDLIAANNTELVANIGNFIHRTMTFAYKNYKGELKSKNAIDKNDMEIISRINLLIDEFDADMSNFKIGRGLNRVLEVSSIGNKYFQDNKPWELINADRDGCEKVLFVCIGICKALSVLLYPYLPDAAEQLAKSLNTNIELLQGAKILPQGEVHINEPKQLFKKIEDAKAI